jgi:general secretion pathway protein A
MYKKTFGFNQKPFSVTPDPTFYYPGQSHREALASMRYGVRERMGFIVLTGEVGAGKTFLIRSLLKELGDVVKRALILNPILEPDELFQAILEDLEVPFEKDASFVSQLSAFNEFLLKEHKEGNLVVVLIDESQDLSTDALERLRLLSNLETDSAKLVQIVLVGQPELNDLLALPVLRQLDQRVALRHHLEPFTREETPEYIQHRLNIASGGEPKISFDAAAAKRIHRASGGVPRVIGSICEHALNTAFIEEQRVVGAKIAREAISKARNRAHSTRPLRSTIPFGWKKWAPAAIGAICLIAALALSASALCRKGGEPNDDRVLEAGWSQSREPRVVTALPASSLEEASDPEFETESLGALTEALEREPLVWDREPAEETHSGVRSEDAPIEVAEDEITHDSIVGAVIETPAEEFEEAETEAEVTQAIDKFKSTLAEAPRDIAPTPDAIESCPAPETEPSLVIEPVPVILAREESATRYGLQVASLQSLERAQRLASEVKRFGPVFLVPWRSGESGEWIRVVLGAYPNRKAGEETLDLLAGEPWAKDARLIENRWWRQVSSANRNEVFTLAGE